MLQEKELLRLAALSKAEQIKERRTKAVLDEKQMYKAEIQKLKIKEAYNS